MAREHGFSLDEIRKMLALKATGKRYSGEAEIAARQLADVRAKIASLQSIERGLQKLVTS